MSLMDNLGELLKQVTGKDASPTDVHAAYDQVATAVPKSDLADGLAHAFRSDQTPAFEQMVSGLYGQSSGEQKAGLLNKILATLGGGGATQALAGAGGLGGLGSVLGGGSVTPQQAQQVPPEAVQVLAQRAAQKDPGIMDQAAGFYAQHPTLVKSIGAGALAILMSKISTRR